MMFACLMNSVKRVCLRCACVCVCVFVGGGRVWEDSWGGVPFPGS